MSLEGTLGNYIAVTKEFRRDQERALAKEEKQKEAENKKAKLKGARNQERTREGGR